MEFPRQEYWSGLPFSTPGVFLTQGSNLHLLGKKNNSLWLQLHQFSSVQSLSRVQLFATSWTAACQASLTITNFQTCSNSCPWSWWCHPTISSSVVPFSSCLQSFPASVSFLRSQFFTSGGQRIGASASTSVLPTNIQDWFLLDCYKIIDQICVCLFHGLSILFHGFMCLFIWW